MSTKQNYKNLIDYVQETQTLASIDAVLSWDQETYMPEEAITHRSNQVAVLSKLVHSRWTSSKFRVLLNDCLNLDTGEILGTFLSDLEKKQLSLIFSDWKKKMALPAVFVETFSKEVSKATHIWQNAKKENNYNLFKPHLKKLIELSKQKALFINSEAPIYDTLLDEFEPGMTTATLVSILDPLKKDCVDMLHKIKSSNVNISSIDSEFDFQKQLDLSKTLLRIMNFDFKRGRLDTSSHPFTIDIHPTDVRLTTRISETNFFEAITSTIHEAGHGLYEQGLAKDYFGLGLGQSVSLGIHESQSRFWENHIGKSLSFWESIFPELVKVFPAQFENLNGYELWQSVNKVTPGLIRVDADEISYCLHIIIRFECELKLFDGSLSVDDLPDYWNSLYKDYLGVSSNNDAEATLQDIHWATGAFGYFPTYVLGSIFAAQLDQAMIKNLQSYESCLQTLALKPINNWLKSNIFSYGRIYESNTLIEKVTGKKIDVACFISYLKNKYNKLYKLEL